jgi:glutathione S-transferase
LNHLLRRADAFLCGNEFFDAVDDRRIFMIRKRGAVTNGVCDIELGASKGIRDPRESHTQVPVEDAHSIATPQPKQGGVAMSIARKLVVHGHYVSQPSRAVLWLLKIHNHPFEFHKVEPLKGETRKEEFKKIFPTGLAPAIDDDGFYLAEGSAILQYLCEKNEWTQWWSLCPSTPGRRERAKISEYLSHHHHSDRLISHRVVRPYLEEVFFNKESDPEVREKRREFARRSVKKFQDTFLRDGEFVNDLKHPSIADLVAYTEIGQLIHLKILPSFEEFPVTNNWVTKMRSLPSHDDVHRTACKVGEMIENSHKVPS